MTNKNDTKQTAANNVFLANVKRDVESGRFNLATDDEDLYSSAMDLVNAYGEETAREYLQPFTTAPLNY